VGWFLNWSFGFILFLYVPFAKGYLLEAAKK